MLHEVSAIEVQMEYRIDRPLLLQLVDGQSLEQRLVAQEVVLQRRDKQTLPKSPWATQEIDLPILGEVIHQGRLIHIDETILTNLIKALYANRVLHNSPLYYFCRSK